MIGEIVALVVLLVGIAIFGALAWRLTLHLIGLDPQEVAMWRTRFRERRTSEARPGTSNALAPVSATPTGLGDRIDRVLTLVEDKPRKRSSS
jgi:hypothetical protein